MNYTEHSKNSTIQGHQGLPIQHSCLGNIGEGKKKKKETIIWLRLEEAGGETFLRLNGMKTSKC